MSALIHLSSSVLRLSTSPHTPVPLSQPLQDQSLVKPRTMRNALLVVCAALLLAAVKADTSATALSQLYEAVLGHAPPSRAHPCDWTEVECEGQQLVAVRLGNLRAWNTELSWGRCVVAQERDAVVHALHSLGALQAARAAVVRALPSQLQRVWATHLRTWRAAQHGAAPSSLPGAHRATARREGLRSSEGKAPRRLKSQPKLHDLLRHQHPKQH